MDKETSELVYWALKPDYIFINVFDQNREDYDEIKKARVKISNRYRELIAESISFREANQQASTEWLMEIK